MKKLKHILESVVFDIENVEKIAKLYNFDVSAYDKKQLAMGYEIEKEHNADPKTDVVDSPLDLIKIVVAHLNELPDYYTRLKKMEKEKSSPDNLDTIRKSILSKEK